MKTKLSIITICFNNLEELKATCESVDQQEELPFEHIIVDGSTDGEIANFLTTVPQPAYRKWNTEPDNGIADAFNKGVKMATGDVLNFMNSGDSFYDAQVLGLVKHAFDLDAQLQWLHGAYIMYRGGVWLTAGTPFELKLLYRGMRQISHQSMFVKASLFEKYGYFSLEKKVAMDYDWVVRMAHEKHRYLTEVLCRFAPGGASYQHVWLGLSEALASYRRYRGFTWKGIFWRIRTYLIFVITQQTLLGKWLFQLKNRKKTLSS